MDLDLDLIVYLRTRPEVSFERMRSRNRKEESGAPLSYLQQLHDAYEDWLIKKKHGDGRGVSVLVLDDDQDVEAMVETYLEYADVIRGKRPLGERMVYAPRRDGRRSSLST